MSSCRKTDTLRCLCAGQISTAPVEVSRFRSKRRLRNRSRIDCSPTGYVTGASAQEEALCRRSTLYEHINQPRFYPFHDEGGLWSAGVRVFRRGDDDDSRILDSEEQWNVGVISVAAIDTPSVSFALLSSTMRADDPVAARSRLTRDGKDYANSLEEQLTFHKVRHLHRTRLIKGSLLKQHSTRSQIIAILRIAKLHQQRALVLGAFGCGVRSSFILSYVT